MKMILPIMALIFAYQVYGQQDDRKDFLFDEYKHARVFQRNGGYSIEHVNFNFEVNKLYFIDKQDGAVKVVSDELMIVSFWVGERVFIPSADGLKEQLHDNGFRLFLHYNIKRKEKKSDLLYGGDNSVASVNTYNDFRGTGYYNFRNSASEISKVYPSYSLLTEKGKEKIFVESKSFLRIFPANKRKVISEYIASERIDFEQPEMVLKLCMHVFKNE